MKSRNFNIRIEEELREQGHKLANSKGLTLSAYLRMLLIEELRKEKERKHEI